MNLERLESCQMINKIKQWLFPIIWGQLTLSRLVPKPWGYEEIWAQTPKYLGKFLYIKAGHQLSKQYHKVKDETIYLMEGMMDLELEHGSTMTLVMLPGQSYRIRPNLIHRMIAVTDVKVAEVSTSEIDDVVRLEDSYGRTGK